MKSTWILGSTSSSSGDSNSSSDLFSLSELSILFYYLAKEIKGMLSCEVNAKYMRPLELITHESPRSFPHTVWIPHLKTVMQRCTHTAVPYVSREDKAKTVPAPFAFHTVSVSPAQHLQAVNVKLLTMTKTLCLKREHWDKCTGVIPHKMLPIVSIMNMKTIY